MTPADRPTVTDDARAEGGVIKIPEGEGERVWAALVADALRTHARAEAERRAREEMGNDYDGDNYVLGFVAGAEWAYARAEAAALIDATDALGQPDEDVKEDV